MTSHDENTTKSNVRILESSSFIFLKLILTGKEWAINSYSQLGLTDTRYVFLCVLQALESKHQKPTSDNQISKSVVLMIKTRNDFSEIKLLKKSMALRTSLNLL